MKTETRCRFCGWASTGEPGCFCDREYQRRKWDGERCQYCGQGYQAVYSVPDAVWAAITPNPPNGGMLCMTCADHQARAAGYELTWFAVSAGRGEDAAGDVL